MSLILRMPRYILIDIVKSFVDFKEVIKLWLSSNEKIRECLEITFTYLSYYYEYCSNISTNFKFCSWKLGKHINFKGVTLEDFSKIISNKDYELLRQYIDDILHVANNKKNMILGLYGTFAKLLWIFIIHILSTNNIIYCFYDNCRKHIGYDCSFKTDCPLDDSKVVYFSDYYCSKYEVMQKYSGNKDFEFLQSGRSFPLKKFVIVLLDYIPTGKSFRKRLHFIETIP